MYDRNYIEQYNAMRICIYTATNKCDYDPYLMHYGVLGMKWGQHLFGKTEASRAGKKRASTVSKKLLVDTLLLVVLWAHIWVVYLVRH